MVELADTLDLGSSGQPCRFKSCHPHHFSHLILVYGIRWFFIAHIGFTGTITLVRIHEDQDAAPLEITGKDISEWKGFNDSLHLDFVHYEGISNGNQIQVCVYKGTIQP